MTSPDISAKDRLFAGASYPTPFAFNGDVAQVFDDMVERSVPLYHDVTRTAADWTLRRYHEGSVVYDVGCSTGTTIDQVAREMSKAGIRGRFVGIDTSEAMIERARAKLKPWTDQHEIRLVCGDASEVSYTGASAVIINYTLQFLPVGARLNLLKRIHADMTPGGLLFLSDKIRSDSPAIHGIMTDVYERFKVSQGYSRTEIERKKEALDNVLVPLTTKDQLQLVEDSGFHDYEPILKWNNFLSIVAVKR